MSQEKFIDKINNIHTFKYDYSKVEYVNARTKIEIICKEHGEFWQLPNLHTQGQGCPRCNESKGERRIRNWLNNRRIKFVAQYKFKECKNKNLLEFDFYLPSHNTVIEFDGLQHFKPTSFGSKKLEKDKIKNFNYIKQNDSIKDEFCNKNGVKIIRIPYVKINKIEEILTTILT
jgi:very-short-patch-repair endonuclease